MRREPFDSISRRPWTVAAWTMPAAIVLLIVAGLAAYHNSFSIPFIYDDTPSIVENPTIRRLWPLTAVLSPPSDSGVTVNGRPLVNLSLALNYHFGGTGVRGYHLTNIIIHLLAGLTLLGVIRRTLQQPGLRERFGRAATQLALAAALVWTVHPLQTESVSYVIQRAESLAGLFCLLTFYCFIRAVHARSAGWWWAPLAILSCLAGMASKEVMVGVPLLVLLYDRTFVSEKFSVAILRHWRIHAGLAATWLLLAFLVFTAGGRGGTAGFGHGVPWWAYAFTQCRAIVRYLGLSAWPHPLVFDYGTILTKQAATVAPQFVLLVILAGGTIVASWRRRAIGFLGACFFVILAPSSSVLPVITETIAEHRMYLSLAPVVVLGTVGLFELASQKFAVITSVLAVGLGMLTIQRNTDYRTELAIWANTAARCPESPRAHNNLGEILSRTKQAEDEAVAHIREALRLRPDYLDARCNLARSLIKTGRVPEALTELATALQQKYDYAPAHNMLGSAYYAQGQQLRAATEFRRALQMQPNYADAHNNLGVALMELGEPDQAVGHFVEALRIRPEYPDACFNYGNALVRLGQLGAARAKFEFTLRLRPDYAETHNNLGALLVRQGALPEAMTHFDQAVRLKPDYADARNNLGVLLHHFGRDGEAARQFEAALRIKPDYSDARANLAEVLKALPKSDEKPRGDAADKR